MTTGLALGVLPALFDIFICMVSQEFKLKERMFYGVWNHSEFMVFNEYNRSIY